MGGGLESRCVGRVCGADVAVRYIISFHILYFVPSFHHSTIASVMKVF